MIVLADTINKDLNSSSPPPPSQLFSIFRGLPEEAPNVLTGGLASPTIEPTRGRYKYPRPLSLST